MKKRIILLSTIFLLTFLSSSVLAANVPKLQYQSHVSDIGWMNTVTNPNTAGTTGQAKSLEAVIINPIDFPSDSQITYEAHCTNIGWEGIKSNGEIAGTTGRAYSLQAVRLNLTGSVLDNYDLYYRIHSANIGWLGWAKNGEIAGTTGFNCPAEAIELQLVPKDSFTYENKLPANYTKESIMSLTKVNYITEVKDHYWTTNCTNGEISGTTGQNIPIDKLVVDLPYFPNSVQYQVHMSNEGWNDWVTSTGQAGNSNNYMEAFAIRLKSPASALFDIYYQAHVENKGWMGWAKNGEPAGTSNGALKLQAIKVVLVPKNGAAPGDTTNAYEKISRFNRAAIYPPTGRVIYINIAHQHLYFFNENGEMQFETPVTTGWRGKTDTPTGHYRLLKKSREVYLNGRTLVHFWLPFIGTSYGIHDADGWRNNYGGDVYTYDGSAGCVNVPYDNCVRLFNLVRVGDAITIE